MKTNFDFLKSEPKFRTFADTAINAEKVFSIDCALCATSCRMALEFAVKWLYSVDSGLKLPYDDKLVTLLCTDDFRDIIDANLYRKADYIRKLGNAATHNAKGVTKDQAELALKNLFSFMDFIAYCYGDSYESVNFDPGLLRQKAEETPKSAAQLDFEKLKAENESLKKELTGRRVEREKSFATEPIDYTEKKTRKAYIDLMLEDAGWERGKNWTDEYPIDEMPNKSGFGAADYVLWGDDGKPLAVIEAKRTSKNVERGRQQAVLYANFLEKKFKQRPVIFMTNGYETRIFCDKYYPERPVSGIYSKRDLEKEFNKMSGRTHLDNITIKDSISNRYYQKEAIKAVCDTFDRRNRRKALLVMATGSGKTRTVISIVDVLTRHSWVKNTLFLADRTSLVIQAKRSFNSLLPDLSLCNLVENKEDASARIVFSTYQTMMGCIDETCGDDGKRLFTCGHFDLIICDEAHRSIYNKYRDIFTYFDALLVGLTATPKSDIDKNTYGEFELEEGVPTYGYELARAVEDKYLNDFWKIPTKLKFMDEGITYAKLTEKEKEEYENTFADEDGNIPENIGGNALNEWVFNKDTIERVLNILMTNGLKVDFGTKVGKTIIFAKSHRHAEEILKVFNEQYPNLPPHFMEIIDNKINYAQSLIDQFSDKNKMPQIAVSVDMLDTGIDVPEIVNLIFFKKVMSKAKFWQMIGRGTRLCEDLNVAYPEGVSKDKGKFYIFDFCRNFEFFDEKPKGKEALAIVTLQQRIFNLKTDLIYKLQDQAFQTDELKAFRIALVDDLLEQISALNRDNFAVKQHMRQIDKYSTLKAFEALEYRDTLEIAEHIAPLIDPSSEDVSAVRFDALMYQIELAYLAGKTYRRAQNDLIRKVSALASYSTIPEVGAKSGLFKEILHSGFLKDAGINEFEKIRTELRDLMKFINSDPKAIYLTNFTDDVTSIEWQESDLENDDLADYKKKVNYYIRQHEDNAAIAKLKGNVPLSSADVKELEHILWSEVGTRQDYEKEYGNMPLGELIRSIVGLDITAANEAFSKFLNDVNLDQRQIYFVKQIVNYVVKNGVLKDLTVLQQSPFTDMGSISEIFTDVTVFMDIRKTIEAINKNAVAA